MHRSAAEESTPYEPRNSHPRLPPCDGNHADYEGSKPPVLSSLDDAGIPEDDQTFPPTLNQPAAHVDQIDPGGNSAHANEPTARSDM